MSTRYNLKFFCACSLESLSFYFFFSTKKLIWLFILKEVQPSLDSKKFLQVHLITCSRHYDILVKTGSRMTMATTFSHQNDAGSRACSTQY